MTTAVEHLALVGSKKASWTQTLSGARQLFADLVSEGWEYQEAEVIGQGDAYRFDFERWVSPDPELSPEPARVSFYLQAGHLSLAEVPQLELVQLVNDHTRGWQRFGQSYPLYLMPNREYRTAWCAQRMRAGSVETRERLTLFF
jgi:hypothetical protein